MKKILFLLAVSLFAFQLTSFASVSITGLSGIIKITSPGGGAPITIKSGDGVPAIADGSTIIVVAGQVTVATTGSSTADLTTRGNKIAMTPGNTIEVTLNTNGAVKVYDSDGLASIKTSDGKTSGLKSGQTIVIAGSVEAYQPPAFNPGPVNTQVQIDNHRKDISPTS